MEKNIFRNQTQKRNILKIVMPVKMVTHDSYFFTYSAVCFHVHLFVFIFITNHFEKQELKCTINYSDYRSNCKANYVFWPTCITRHLLVEYDDALSAGA